MQVLKPDGQGKKKCHDYLYIYIPNTITARNNEEIPTIFGVKAFAKKRYTFTTPSRSTCRLIVIVSPTNLNPRKCFDGLWTKRGRFCALLAVFVPFWPFLCLFGRFWLFCRGSDWPWVVASVRFSINDTGSTSLSGWH